MYNVDCATYKNRVGIWVTGKNGGKFDKEEKIGAIGLRLKNWITYHGLSFNINPDMKNYKYINACGLENYRNTSLKELGININENRFDEEFSRIFLKNLNSLK
jgi:lipoyl(octanoyl) transferase